MHDRKVLSSEGGVFMRRIYIFMIAIASLLVILGCRSALSDTLGDVARDVNAVRYGICMYAGAELVKIEPLIDDNGESYNVFCSCGEMSRGDVDSSKCDMTYPCSMSEDGAKCARGFEGLPAGGTCQDLGVGGVVELYCVVPK